MVIAPWTYFRHALDTAGSKLCFQNVGTTINKPSCVVLQVGHRDFDVEKKLRRDLKRTHALLADAQLLLATINSSDQNLPDRSKDQIEHLHCQVCSLVHKGHTSTITRPELLLTVFLFSLRRARRSFWRLWACRQPSHRSWRTLRWNWRTSAGRRVWWVWPLIDAWPECHMRKTDHWPPSGSIIAPAGVKKKQLLPPLARICQSALPLTSKRNQIKSKRQHNQTLLFYAV